MPAASRVEILPPAVLSSLNERLRASKYSGMVAHATWLGEQGYEMSKSAVQRYSVRLRRADVSRGYLHAQVAAENHENTLQLVLAEIKAFRAEVTQLLRSQHRA